MQAAAGAGLEPVTEVAPGADDGVEVAVGVEVAHRRRGPDHLAAEAQRVAGQRAAPAGHDPQVPPGRVGLAEVHVAADDDLLRPVAIDVGQRG